MTSANFHISYASVANALFEHIEQDLLALTTALLDDDDETPALHRRTGNVVPAEAGTQASATCCYIKRYDSFNLGFPPARERRAYNGGVDGV
jgi:hypothetical protein